MIPLGRNHKRIVIKPDEVLVLRELSIHRILDAGEVHKLYNVFSSSPRNANAITNRLRKMVHAKIMVRVEVGQTLINPFRQYYYKLGKRGIEVLIQAGMLSKKKGELLHNYLTRTKVPKPHNLAIAKLTNHITKEAIDRGIANYTHYRGIEQASDSDTEPEAIIADWVFQRLDISVFLEVDSGSERLSKIKEKFRKYMQIAKEKNDESIVVVFSVMDETVDPKFEDRGRSQRVLSIKECLPPKKEWPQNLSVISVTAERTVHTIIRILQGYLPSPKELRDIFIDNWIKSWREVAVGHYSIETIDKESIYLDTTREKSLDAESIIRLEKDGKTRKIGVVFAEEGSVESYQKIRNLHNRTEGKFRRGESLDELMVVYEKKEYMEQDVLRADFPNASLTYHKVWKNHHSAFPKVAKQASIYRKELIPFE